MVLVVVTQFEKIGSLMHVSCGNAADPAEAAFAVKHLVGFRPNLLFDVCAQQIAKKVAATTAPPLPLLLGLALKEPDTKLLRVVVDLVQENRAW